MRAPAQLLKRRAASPGQADQLTTPWSLRGPSIAAASPLNANARGPIFRSDHDPTVHASAAMCALSCLNASGAVA